jgi:hypothetical protein
MQAFPETDAVRHNMDQWVLGYVSGLNMIWVQLKKPDPLAPANPKEILRSVADYCRAHPGKTLANAANDVWFRLVKQ